MKRSKNYFLRSSILSDMRQASRERLFYLRRQSLELKTPYRPSAKSCRGCGWGRGCFSRYRIPIKQGPREKGCCVGWKV